MTIIDRYILRQFAQTFVICFLSLTGLYIMIDAVTNIEHFVRCGQKADGVFPFMARYYAYHSISFFDRTNGILALVSAMFTIAWIQRHNEMTALMASGVSRLRIAAPVIAAVGMVSVFSVVTREVIIPRNRVELATRPQDPMGDLPQAVNPCYDNKTNVRLDGKNTYASEKRVEEPSFVIRRAELGEYGKQLVAANAYYTAADEKHPNGYWLKGVREPKNLDTRPSLPREGEPVLITPHDANWLKRDECFLCSDVDFEQLAGGDSFKQLSSTFQLIRALRNRSLDYGADVRVAIHARILQPLLDMTLLFLGLPLIARRESRNVFLAMGVCIVVTTAFNLTVIGMQKLGDVGLMAPSRAVWAPLILFVPVAVGLADSLRK